MNATRTWACAAIAAWMCGCASQSANAPANDVSSETHEVVSDAESNANAVVRDELAALEQNGATRVSIVVLDPNDGRIIAAAGDDLDQHVSVGSTIKPFTIAAALDAGLDPTRRFPGHEGRWRDADDHELADAHPREWLDARDVLTYSSNVGAGQIVEAVGSTPVETMLGKVGVRAESTGWPARGAGVDAHVTPLRLAGAYAAFANGGLAIEPSPDGSGARERVMSEATARAVRDMLETAVSDEGTGHRARVDGHRVGGKTGTARMGVAVFAGIAPLEAPRWVVVVRVEAEGAYGGSVAAPAFSRIVTKLLRAS